jgi:hypothetical protein
MREAETVLDIIRERGHHRSPLRDLYRQLYNPHLYLRVSRVNYLGSFSGLIFSSFSLQS